MESEYRGGRNGVSDHDHDNMITNKRRIKGWDLLLRVATVVLSLAAVVVLAFDKQTTTAALTLVPTLPALNVPATAKWHYLSAFV